MSEAEPIARLIAGFKSFRATYYEQRPERIRRLIEEGQHPEIAIVACSDSRVDPALLLQLEPGELFVVRNVANLVPPYAPDSHYHGTSAALEFAVRDLAVSHIVVLGHSGCGGIEALIGAEAGAAGEPRDFIASWMSIARTARDEVDHGQKERDQNDHDYTARAVEQAVIRMSLANLLTFPWIRTRVEDDTLVLHGWWFDLAAGELLGLRGPSETFSRLG